ncbi:Mediator of RNA polymerase II transcription subunit 7 [Aphanomyces cochlioides]|nr:Mediator of RNA polymerase II transcription subunit 7 [Aphanomyces cochlioides]
MSDEPELVSAFPAPPTFFNLYADSADAGPAPPAPLKPTYHSFGTPYSTEDAVPDLLPDDKKLYEPTHNVKEEMKKVNRSLMFSFLELIDVLIMNPTKFNAKLDDIELLFLNMHNLINAYRPHQARETLIELLKQQLQERKDAAAEIRRTIEESKQAVLAAHSALDVETPFEITDAPSMDVASAAASPNIVQDAAADADAAASSLLEEERQRNQEEHDQFFASCQAILDSSALSHSV